MKKLFFIFFTLFIAIGAYCQVPTKYVLPYDTVIVMKPNGVGYLKASKGNFADTLFLNKAKLPTGTNGYVWTSDANGNMSLRAASGGSSIDFIDSLHLDTLLNGRPIIGYGNSLTFAFDNRQGYPYSSSQLFQNLFYRNGLIGATSDQIRANFQANTGESRKYGHVFEMGRNNTGDLTTLRSEIFSNLQIMLDTLAVYNNDKWVVLSIFNAGGEGTGTTILDSILAVNAALAATYPGHYADIRTYMVNSYNPAVPQDVYDHSVNVPAFSLRIDSLHYNANGYYLWGNFLDSLFYNTLVDTSGRTEVLNAQQSVAIISGFANKIVAKQSFHIANTSIAYVPNEYKSPSTVIYGNGGRLLNGSIGSNTIGGIDAFLTATTAASNSIWGNIAGYKITTGSSNNLFGFGAGYGITSGTGNNAIGDHALGSASNITASGNNALGTNALFSNTTGDYNLAVGHNSMISNSSGIYNTATGTNSLVTNSAGSYNAAFGYFSLYYNLATQNSAFGAGSGAKNTTGIEQVYVGASAGYGNETGSRNTAVGYEALLSDVSTAFNTSDVVGLGRHAGFRNRGSRNIFLGSNAGGNDTITGNNNILLCYNCDLPDTAVNGQLSIGNLIFAKGGFGDSTKIGLGSVGIKTNNPDSSLTVVGGIRFATGRQQAGYVLTSTGTDGGADWQPASGGGSSLFPTTETGTATGNVTGDLAGNDLNILNDNGTYQGSVFVQSVGMTLNSYKDDFSSGASLQMQNNNGDNTDGIQVSLYGTSTYRTADLTDTVNYVDGSYVNKYWVLNHLGNLPASGANTALSNLASVAINLALLPGTDNSIALGSTSKEWSDGFFGNGAVINFANGDATITHSTNTLTTPNRFLITGTLTNNYQFLAGTFAAQTYQLNNAFLSENAYFNGSSWTRIFDGYAEGFQFFNGQIMFHNITTGSGTFTQSVNAKVDYNGNFAIGPNIQATAGNFSGANFLFTAAGKLGIGTVSPDASALVDMTSTTTGLLPPRMTTTQKNAISSPAEGLIVYDLTLHKLCVRTASTWEVITSL